MKILVCGGRDFDDWDLLKKTLNLYTDNGGDTIITGDACGADWLARAYAKYNGHPYKGYPADWKTYGKSAGAIRNQQMLDEGKPDLVIAFPGGNGTKDMVDKATNKGVKVIEVNDQCQA